MHVFNKQNQFNVSKCISINNEMPSPIVKLFKFFRSSALFSILLFNELLATYGTSTRNFKATALDDKQSDS